ncbi:hypothetical protein [Lysinibacillus sphaericus]|uniref:hypothetical protein n=1 Tax=Lysinibacillus sphaericus TaxID=1421 RepID=UPI001C8F0606|nr:hypothetical protein [Lysinibacillus sp. SDF0037]
MSIDDLLSFVQAINSPAVSLIIEDLIGKLASLQLVGLNYLTLNRNITTLSGGESQR